jgi:hypothetical protein
MIPDAGHYVKTRFPLVQVTFRSFLRDDASQIHSFLKLCCCSLNRSDLFLRRSLARRRVSGARYVSQPQLGPELRGQVRLIRVFEVSDELWQQCCPALYPAEVFESQKIVKEDLLHHPIRSLSWQRCGPINKPKATKEQRLSTETSFDFIAYIFLLLTQDFARVISNFRASSTTLFAGPAYSLPHHQTLSCPRHGNRSSIPRDSTAVPMARSTAQSLDLGHSLRISDRSWHLCLVHYSPESIADWHTLVCRHPLLFDASIC